MARPPNHKRREMAALLRAKGLSFREIGQRLGISKQGAQHLAQVMASRQRLIRCRECNARIPSSAAMRRDDCNVYCIACLDNHPDVAFREHLKAYRLAAGLTMRALSLRAGLPEGMVSEYERGNYEPARWTKDKLLRLVGARPRNGEA